MKIALLIEGLTSAFIAALLGIENQAASRTLGNKGSAFSFNQKIDLLIDLGALSEDTKSKFAAFMEIRNQFMHNMEASTFENSYSFLGPQARMKNLRKPGISKSLYYHWGKSSSS